MSSHKGLQLGPKVSWQQIERLVSFLEQHSCLVENSWQRSRPVPSQKKRQLWRQLAELLNAQGPSKKSPALWRGVWRRTQTKAREAAAGQTVVRERPVSGKVRNLLERVMALIGPTNGAGSTDDARALAGGSGSSQHPLVSSGGQGAPLRTFLRIAPADSRPSATAAAASIHSNVGSGGIPAVSPTSSCGASFVPNDAETGRVDTGNRPPLATQEVWISADDNWPISSDRASTSARAAGARQQAARPSMEELMAQAAADYTKFVELARDSNAAMEVLGDDISELASAAARLVDAQESMAAACERQAQATVRLAEATERLAAVFERLVPRHSETSGEDDLLAMTVAGLLRTLCQMGNGHAESPD